eukprot:1160769-Pelagomonas_calceolata.AAC.2
MHRSRGKSVCRLSLPLVQVLRAAGLHCPSQLPSTPLPSDKTMPATASSAGHAAASHPVPPAGPFEAGSSSQVGTHADTKQHFLIS